MDVVQSWSMDATDVMRFKVCSARDDGLHGGRMEVKMEGSGNDLTKGG